MSATLPETFEQLLGARTREEFREQVVRYIKQLGFETVTAMTLFERGAGRPERVIVDNTPASYKEPYFDDPSARRDPILNHCAKSSVPLIWDQQTYLDNNAGDLWEHQARYGYRTGVAMAMHLASGKHFVLGVDRDQALPSDRRQLQRIVADLQLFVVHAQDAALRLLLPPSQLEPQPSLSGRELEALRWTMEGKTAWEVGALMGITERTAVWHLTSSMRKLDCVNKHQAVLKALRAGFIS